jgi:hypothetical protein
METQVTWFFLMATTTCSTVNETQVAGRNSQAYTSLTVALCMSQTLLAAQALTSIQDVGIMSHLSLLLNFSKENSWNEAEVMFNTMRTWRFQKSNQF